jgi:uncharacterized repeat protein (TIGR02543 family)
MAPEDNFLGSAFNAEEQGFIAETEIENLTGDNTPDKVFYLSIQEANNNELGFNDDSDRIAHLTAYAVANGAYVNGGNAYWWLRSPGNSDDFAEFVTNVGHAYLSGNAVNRSDLAARPALFLTNLESLIFTSTATGDNYIATPGCTVTFDAHGGSSAEQTRIVMPGAAVGTLPDVTRPGFTFDGWYTAETGGEKVTEATTVTEDVTYHAQWTAKGGYKVTYDTDGGNVIAGKTGVKWTDKNLLPAIDPTKAGYTFDGWRSGSVALPAVTTETAFSDLAANDATEGVTFTAQWTEKVGYKVTYDTAGGSAISDKTGVKWTDKNLLPAIDPTKAGYTFDGWRSENVALPAVTTETAFSDLAANDAVEGVTLTAQWTAQSGYTDATLKSFTISEGTLTPAFDPATTNYTVTVANKVSRITLTIAASGESATFNGNGARQLNVGENRFEIKVTAEDGVTVVTYTVTVTREKEEAAPPPATVNITTTTVNTAITYDANGTTTTVNTTITYDANGGKAVDPRVRTVTEGSAYGALPVATRKGCTFKGWYTAKAGGVKVTENTIVTQDGDHTLYAQWEANKYKVKFNANGGKLTAGTKTKAVKYGAKIGKLPKPTRTQYNFKGWYTKKAGGAKVSATMTSKTAANRTLYAHWTKQERYGKVVKTAALYIRENPSRHAYLVPVTGYLKQGQTFKIGSFTDNPGESNDWYSLNYKGKTAYVFAKYVKTVWR